RGQHSGHGLAGRHVLNAFAVRGRVISSGEENVDENRGFVRQERQHSRAVSSLKRAGRAEVVLSSPQGSAGGNPRSPLRAPSSQAWPASRCCQGGPARRRTSSCRAHEVEEVAPDALCRGGRSGGREAGAEGLRTEVRQLGLYAAYAPDLFW